MPFTFYLDDIRYVKVAAEEASVEVSGSTAPPSAPGTSGPGKTATLPFSIYGDAGAKIPYIPAGYMGNGGAIQIEDASTETPHGGTTCLKVSYNANDNWGGVVWQDPANDWGEQPGGYNLTGAASLEFWARGASGGEKISFGFGLIGPDKFYSDTGKGEVKDVLLSNTWQHYCIPLTGLNLSRIKTAFYWTLGGQGKPVVFYLDDIQFNTTPCQ